MSIVSDSSRVDLSYRAIDASNLLKHEKILSSGSRFRLEGNPIDRKALDLFFSIVRDHQSIQELDLAACPLGTDGLELLAERVKKMASLRFLSIRTIQADPKGFTSLFRAIHGSSILEKLDISYDRFNSENIKYLALSLKSFSSLSSLNVRYCSIPKDDLCSFMDAIGDCKNLHILNMSHLFNLDAISWKALAENIKKIPLESLDLTSTHITSESLGILCPTLKAHTTLKKICLDMNVLDIEAVLFLAQILKQTTTLETLSLFGCQLGSEGGAILADALAENQTLRSLNLHANQLGTQGAQAISRVLYKNKTLQSLNLEHNHITDLGGRVLKDALVNSAIVSINLKSNRFSASLETELKDISSSIEVILY